MSNDLKIRPILLTVVSLILIAGLGYLAVRYHSQSTIRTVVPGRVYRSGQPTARLLRKAEQMGVRRVVNLRGDNRGSAWYRRERAQITAAGMTMKDIRFQGLDAMPRIEVLELVRELDAAQPLLLHCADGWDRTGWASAVTLALRGEPFDAVLHELSPARGHLCRPERCHFHRFFQHYTDWLQRAGKSHDARTFREWVLDYAPGKYKAATRVRSEPSVTAGPGEIVAFPVSLRNESDETWVVSGARPVQIGARLLPGDRDPAAALALFRKPNGPARDLGRAHLPGDVKPGQTVETVLEIRAPVERGTYSLHIDVVEEHVHWFSDLGREGVIVKLHVSGS